jgi:hypothetical protein
LNVKEWQSVTAVEIYNVLASFIVQKHSLSLYISQDQLAAMPMFGSVIYLNRFESICKFLLFTDNTSKDTFEGPQKLFKTSHHHLPPFKIPDPVSDTTKHFN